LAAAASGVHGLTGTDWALIVALICVLVIAGLASASETALTSINRLKLRHLVEQGNRRAQRISRLISEPNIFLSTILIVNSVALIVASTLAAVIALDVSPTWGGVVSTVVISIVVLMFCEITPKTAALQSPERWALALVPLVHGASVVLHWPIIALTRVTSLLVRMFGGQPPRRGPFVTEEELRLLVEVGEEEGVLEEEEKEMIHNVFELGDTTAREVMIPRIDMVTVEADDTVDEAVRLILQGGLSRIPVYSESIDNIIGVLYAKDLLRALATAERPSMVRSLVRPAYFVPETKRADDLLHELQQHHVHMAIVVDEYGGVAGLVTIEDLVEEIIGPIQDEYDREEVLYEKLSDNEYVVDAKIGIEDFNELLGTDLTTEDYDTLGGFVYAQLDKIPIVGDIVRHGDLTFTVLGTRGRRVTKVKIVRGAPGVDPGAAADQESTPAIGVESAAAAPPPPADQSLESGSTQPSVAHAPRGASGDISQAPSARGSSPESRMADHDVASSPTEQVQAPPPTPPGAEGFPGARSAQPPESLQQNPLSPRARGEAGPGAAARISRQRYVTGRHGFGAHGRDTSRFRHR
jgi:CBS domain containing-hemolysin-like protein